MACRIFLLRTFMFFALYFLLWVKGPPLWWHVAGHSREEEKRPRPVVIMFYDEVLRADNYPQCIIQRKGAN
jgi:hypothetical protein